MDGSEEERPEKKSKSESSGGKGTVIRSSHSERVKKKSEEAKKKAREKVLASCDEDPVSETIKKNAEKYALHRKSSKSRFLWKQEMPEVDADDQKLVRRYAKEHLMEKVPMVTVKDRYGKDIQCPIFPEETIITEVMLPKELWDEGDPEQFKYLDKIVKETMKDKFPDFTPGTRMCNGKKYTWHHHQDEGKMQLVENGIHSATQHSGGREIWAAERLQFGE